MATVRGFFFKITWNGNTLLSSEPLDRPIASSKPRAGSAAGVVASGSRDTWITGHQQFVSGEVRRVPGEDQSTGYAHTATGWDGATGWRAFLEYARDGGAFNFYPNKDAGTNYPMYLLEPFDTDPAPETNGFRRFTLLLESTADTPIVGY